MQALKVLPNAFWFKIAETIPMQSSKWIKLTGALPLGTFVFPAKKRPGCLSGPTKPAKRITVVLNPESKTSASSKALPESESLSAAFSIRSIA